jgi:hypothetical protein
VERGGVVVSARGIVLAGMAAACVMGGPARAADVDSSAFETWRLEDALDLAEDEAAFVPGPAREDGGGAATLLRGDLVVADDGARRLRAALVRPRVRGELLLAREAGETRAVDDAYAALRFDPAAGLRFGLGWLEPRVGAGLVLGPRRTGAAAPSFAPPAAGTWLGAGLATTPARAAAGHRGLAVEIDRGAFRLAALAAATPREARPSGAAWWPVLGVRHRRPDEEARRGRLEERLLALAVEGATRDGRARAWLLGLATRTDPRRAPHDGTSAAAESAAAILHGGPAGETGARWRSADGATTLEGALALDAGGRARTRALFSTRSGGVRAGVLVETEARGFVPPRALPERRPRAHAALRLEGGAVALEAHAVERGPLERARPWIALELTPAARLRLAARHDGEPRATRWALRVDGGTARAGVEARFDRAGLARRTAWVGLVAPLRAGLELVVDARLAGGRSGAAWIDDDVSGGRLVLPGRAAGRTRIELRRNTLGGSVRAGLAPRLAWTRTTSPDGQADEVRFQLAWVSGVPE